MLRVCPENIPQGLKERHQWVLWKSEIREGKPTKIPYCPKDPKLKAKANKPETWGTHDEALNLYEARKGNGIAGIGYEFSYYDPYSGIDLDHCRDPKTGKIDPWALEIIKQFNSYTEISPSGTGVHIWLKAKFPNGAEDHQKNLPGGGKIEVYDVGRYFTVTGHHLEGTPATIQDRGKELKAFHAQVIAKHKAQPKPAGPTPILSLADSEIIEKARAAQNGSKFDRLMRGDTSEYGGDASSADIALCSILSFWTQNPDQIDRIFRTSGLYRDKWERQDYRDRTIGKALVGRTEIYQGPQSKPQGRPQVFETPRHGPKNPAPFVIPTWPQEVMAGASGKFAHTYAEYLETPQSFLFMAHLTFLGHVISDRITLQSELTPQPRLFTILLGESADDRKSTSISKSCSFYSETLDPENLNTIFGVGSAEGLAKCFKKKPRAILILDELKSLIQKMRIDASVLLPCINTLFESKHFYSITKKHDIMIDEAELCLLAASTLETYRTMFNSTFLDIGFLNRLFIIIGNSERKFSIPAMIPQAIKDSLKSDLKEVLAFMGRLSQNGPYAMPIESKARDIFDAWYFEQEKTVFTRRLDSYGHRLMPLLAINEMQDHITPEIVEKTATLLNYQLVARKYADPIDADNSIARLEEKIRRALEGGPLSKRELERRGNKTRVGIWLWEMALKNLRNAGEIFCDSKTKEYRLND